jgi:flavin reductase (DIM6/NTAB) family NADH-FMN oxidoreductase RutF
LLGAPVLTNAIAALECTLDQYQAVGTHGVFIGGSWRQAMTAIL